MCNCHCVLCVTCHCVQCVTCHCVHISLGAVHCVKAIHPVVHATSSQQTKRTNHQTTKQQSPQNLMRIKQPSSKHTQKKHATSNQSDTKSNNWYYSHTWPNSKHNKPATKQQWKSADTYFASRCYTAAACSAWSWNGCLVNKTKWNKIKFTQGACVCKPLHFWKKIWKNIQHNLWVCTWFSLQTLKHFPDLMSFFQDQVTA